MMYTLQRSTLSSVDRAEQLVPSGMSATVFDPYTQSWHRVNSTGLEGHLNRKIARSLGWRLAAACSTPGWSHSEPESFY